MEKLPTDIIIEEIFSRLPVEPTLLRCKRVCRTWRELLRKYKTGMLFQYISEGKIQLYYGHQDEVTLESYYSNKKLARFEHVEFENSYNYEYYMVGSCNGLVCLRSGICNPVTGEFLRFSDTRPIFGLSGGIGFGYLPSTSEYKVVGINFSAGKRQGQVQVYTLGSQTGWRIKEDIINYNYILDMDMRGIFANGAIHWMCNTAENGSGQKYKIYAFDLADEKFKDVPVPALYNPFPWKNSRAELMLLGGNLCIVHHVCTNETIDIWAFKKNTASIWPPTVERGKYYDYNWSWTRDFSLPEQSEPFAITRSNEVLTRGYGQKLYCYNGNTSTITKSWDGGDKGSSCFQAIPHINTLVSLKELGECFDKNADESVKHSRG